MIIIVEGKCGAGHKHRIVGNLKAEQKILLILLELHTY
jgi:hypothetical protein